MGASDVACRDAPPVIELCEHVFDLVALTVEDFVVVEWNFAAQAGLDARLFASGFEFSSPAVAPTGNIPFSSTLTAVWWAFRCVASIMMRSGFGPSPASPAKIRSKTPRRLQGMKRL